MQYFKVSDKRDGLGRKIKCLCGHKFRLKKGDRTRLDSSADTHDTESLWEVRCPKCKQWATIEDG